VRPVRVNDRIIEEGTLRGLVTFVLVFLVIFALSTVVVFIEAVTNPDISLTALEATSVAIATLGNVGPGFGLVGPMDSFEPFSAQAKLYMTGLMWIGRLEILSVLVILTPSYWRR
jgi:trk system potassium uptake protein TrkH